MTTLEKISAAGATGDLMPSAVENLQTALDAGLPAWFGESVTELVEAKEWAELNDRFYRYLAFGTGGMRGRTTGRVVTET